MPRITLDQARTAKAAAVKRFGTNAKVVGVGITRVGDEYAVKINLSEPADIEIPADIDGVPVRIEIIGKIRRR